MPTKPRYALYTRISKDPTGQSTSPKIQEKECRALAKERGFEIVDVYTDVDLSGYRDVRRPQYEEMLTAMAEGAYDGILVWKLDRLMRRITEFIRFWDIAKANNVALVSKSDQHIDTTSPIGLAIVILIFGLAEQESLNTSTRLKAKERHMAEAGKHKTAGRRAYGMKQQYDADGNPVPGWVEIDEDEAAIIRELAERVLAGDSITGLVRELNERGVPAAAGGTWSRRGMASLLVQARLFGWREHHHELKAKGDWPVILDEETGKKLRDLLLPTLNKGGQRTARKYMLSGLLVCGRCGKGLAAQARGGSRSTMSVYRCRSKADGGCNGTATPMERTDDVIGEMILYRLDSPNMAAMLRSRKDRRRNGDDAEILTELGRIADVTQENATALAKGKLSMAGYEAAQKALDEEAEDLNRRLAVIRQAEPLTSLLTAKDGIRQTWALMSPERRRAVADALLEKVIVHNADSEWYRTNMRARFLEEAQVADAAGDKRLAWKRRQQAVKEPRKVSNIFRPERFEPVWKV